MCDSKLFLVNNWNLDREAENGDKTEVRHYMLNVAFSYGSRAIVQDGKFSCSRIMNF